MNLFNLTDNMKIGIFMVALGLFFLFLGMLFFFDAGLLTIGNALLLAGFPMILGWSKTLLFFNPIERRERIRGIFCFFGGIILVFFFRWSFVGMMIEIVGLADMFGNFLPNIVDFLKVLPYIGPLFSSAPVVWLVDRVRAASASSKRGARDSV